MTNVVHYLNQLTGMLSVSWTDQYSRTMGSIILVPDWNPLNEVVGSM